MLLDKFGEFVYEQASVLLTRWRACCFLITCFLFSGVIFDVMSLSFWMGSFSEAIQVFSRVLDLSLYRIIFIGLLAFLIAPLVSKFLSLAIIDSEYKRASSEINKIESDVVNIDPDALFMYRDKAVLGEKYIQRLRGLNESFVYFLILGGVLIFDNGAIWIYYSVLIVAPFLFFFSVQNLFSVYLERIFFYKKLCEYLSGH